MFNKNAFRAKVVGKGMTLSQVAFAIGINPATLNRKMSGESDFTRAEIHQLRHLLELSQNEADSIFFAAPLA